jgi:Lar family restriction alleviation protein
MTNGEKFKTAEGRLEAFTKFCESFTKCDGCKISKCTETGICKFAWLDLEYKVELRPCPFCGGEDVNTYKSNNADIWYVACGKCGVRTEGDASQEMAIAAWNMRA